MFDFQKELDLLEFLAVNNGCDYLSDLKREPFRSMAISRLYRIPQDAYSAKEWKDAMDYLQCSDTTKMPTK